MPALILTEWLEITFGMRSRRIRNDQDPLPIARSLIPYLGLVEFDVYCNPTPYYHEAPEPGQEYVQLTHVNMTQVNDSFNELVQHQFYKPVLDFHQLTDEQKHELFPGLYQQNNH